MYIFTEYSYLCNFIYITELSLFKDIGCKFSVAAIVPHFGIVHVFHCCQPLRVADRIEDVYSTKQDHNIFFSFFFYKSAAEQNVPTF